MKPRNKWLYKLTHWEYWNTWVIYLSLWPFWLVHSFKNKSFFFFERANPSFPFGGMAMTPKSLIYQLIPPQHLPKTVLIRRHDRVLEKTKEAGLKFPLVAKPDTGLKGLGVEILQEEEELLAYDQKYTFPYLVQEKIPYRNEVGIFYCRYPKEEKGFITGMVKKNFLQVTGDGQRSLEELILVNYRTAAQYQPIKEAWHERFDQIVDKGEKIVLLSIGSHTRGAEFKDVSHLISEELSQCIDAIACQIEGFYYGRFDIMYKDEASLLKGSDFTIVELNGTMSEPTHMYDPEHHLFFGWKEILKHWKIMSEIAYQNRKLKREQLSFRKRMKLIAQSVALEKQLKKELYQ